MSVKESPYTSLSFFFFPCSEVSESTTCICSSIHFIVLLEMLVASEFREESEKDVKTFNDRLVVRKFVAGNVHHRAYKTRVVSRMHINFRSWEWNIFQSLFHFRRPLLNEGIDIGHLFGVVDSGRWSRFVELLNTVDPPRNVLRLLVRALYRLDVHRSRTYHILLLDVTQLYHCFVFRIESRFIEYSDTKILFGAIGLRHLQERVNLAD